MMRYRFVSLTCALALLATASLARAQSATGRAFGTTLDLGGTNVVTQSDTEEQTAPNAAKTPGVPPAGCPTSTSTSADSFDVCVAGATIPASPLAEVVTGPSRTRGCSAEGGCPDLFPTPAPTPGPGTALDPTLATRQFAFSEAGNSTAAVLVGQAAGEDVLNVVSNGSTALVACSPDAPPIVQADSEVNALVIAGNEVPIPGTVEPNTTIVAPQLPLLILNEQIGCQSGSTDCTVYAAHAQLITASEVLDLKVSGSRASVTSPDCVDGDGCGPEFSDSRKESLILQSDRQTAKTPQVPAIGDPVRFTVLAVNSASVTPTCTAEQQTGENVRVVDRIPRGITVDSSSITIQRGAGAITPTTGTIASCGTAEFGNGCSPEPSIDASRNCLTVEAGDIAPGETVTVRFIGTVNQSATGGANPGCDAEGRGTGICNVAIIEADNSGGAAAGATRVSRIICPIPSGVDRIRTTGSGGCSLGDAKTASAMLPMIAVGAALLLRQRRRRRAQG